MLALRCVCVCVCVCVVVVVIVVVVIVYSVSYIVWKINDLCNHNLITWVFSFFKLRRSLCRFLNRSCETVISMSNS